MGTSDGLPSYYDPYEFEHTCLVKCQTKEDLDALEVSDHHLEPSHETKKCIASPFVASDDFHKNDVAKTFAGIIKEVLAILAFSMWVNLGIKADFPSFCVLNR